MRKWLSVQIKSRLPQRATWMNVTSMILAYMRRPETGGRLIRFFTHPTGQALAISLALHCAIFGTLELGSRMGWWKQSLLSATFLARKNKADLRLLEQEKNRNAEATREIPLVFVEVDQTQAAEQPPEDAKYYSARNSRAANRETPVDSNIPKITGTQDKVSKTLENSRPQPMPLQPAPVPQNKPEPPPVEPQPESKAASKPGDLAMAKPSDATKINKESDQTEIPETPKPRPRPRKLDEVKMAQTGSLGDKMKQDGGVRRFATVEGLDVKATPFGSYDAAIIEAIRQRWYDLLDERNFARGDSGKVVLTFRLNSDGSVTQMGVAENEVNEILAILCQRAVQDPAKYPPWPNDMRRLVGAEYREVRFTFHYN